LTAFVTLALPAEFVRVRVTSTLAPVWYVWVGFWAFDGLEPSPKSHSQLVIGHPAGVVDDVLSNVTVFLSLSQVKFGTAFAHGVAVGVGVGVGVAVGPGVGVTVGPGVGVGATSGTVTVSVFVSEPP
jgi:hypothetical protein